MKKFLSLAAMLFAAVSIFAQDPIAVTCAEAKAAMPAEKNAVTEATYIVTGYITNTDGTISREQQTFWMDDQPGSTKTIQGYWCNLPEGEKDIPLKVGDKITLTGQIMNYNNTAEIKNGQVAIIERAVEVPLDTISVSQALVRISENQLGPCFVKGKVMNINTNNVEKYHNISYWLADLDTPTDSIQGWKMKAADNKDYNSAADVEFVVGDEILVYAATLENYQGKNEINGGYFFRTLKSDVIELDWAFGSAYRGEGNWNIVLEKANGDQNNNVDFYITSDKDNAIAGTYSIDNGSISLNGAKSDIEEGVLALSFKEVSETGYNVYYVSISFTAGGKQYRLSSVSEIYATDDAGEEIVLDGDRPFKPTEEGQEITCAQAQEYAFSLPANTDSEISVVVVGYVTDIFSDGQSFWMADQKGSEKVIQAYKFKTVSPAGVGLAKGALVKVSGKITHYVNNNTGASTAEVKNGAVEIVDGGEEIKADEEVNVAEALAVAQALEQNATSEKVYGITGFISSIVYEYDADKGISFWMSDDENDRTSQDFEAYQVHCSPEIGALLEPGVKVRVVAKVTHFHQNATEGEDPKPERTVYETVKGGTVELADGSAVDNIYFDVQAVKFIENGQIIIIRNGVRYNIQGQIAE